MSFESLNEFLDYSKSNYRSAKGIVIGNEAMDLDSTISSIVYSYFKSKKSDLYIPVINIKKEELKFRTDTSYILRKYKIDPNSLIYEPSVREYLISNKNSLEIILVDHNFAEYPFINDNVVEIIDHHVDEGLFRETCKNRIVELVGSCTTLISLEILKSSKNFFLTEMLCSKLIFNVIIADTVNMNPKINKATEKDIQAAKHISTLLKITESKQNEIFNEIRRAYFNVSELSDAEVLDSDYKHFGPSFGMCSCRRRVLDRNELEAYRRKKDVKLLFVMIQSLDERNGFVRELIIYQKYSEQLYKFDDILRFLDEKGLGLEVLESKDEEFVLMIQRNIKYSRKKISPWLKKYFSDL